MAAQTRDHPDVIILAPLLYAVAFGAVLLLRWQWPLTLLPRAVSWWIGALWLVPGCALLVWGLHALRAAGTSVNPYRPTTTLVVTGPYRWSRNPLYLALAVIFVGLSIGANTLWGVLVLVPLLVVMHYGVVLREERYLAAKFGEGYSRYCAAVRRYL
jgi:protein-S-isoprenylcysteine O-methyltransferase Ste14